MTKSPKPKIGTYFNFINKGDKILLSITMGYFGDSDDDNYELHDHDIKSLKDALDKALENREQLRLKKLERTNNSKVVKPRVKKLKPIKYYKADFNHSNNDISWGCSIETKPKGGRKAQFQRLSWYGYNDNNWWKNVIVNEPHVLERKDRYGDIWVLDPHKNRVALKEQIEAHAARESTTI